MDFDPNADDDNLNIEAMVENCGGLENFQKLVEMLGQQNGSLGDRQSPQ